MRHLTQLPHETYIASTSHIQMRTESKNRHLSYLCLFEQPKDPEFPAHASALLGEFYQILALMVDRLKMKQKCIQKPGKIC